MKTRLLALSVMLSLANVLFAQNDITVIWEGYDVTNKGKSGSWTDDQFNNTFLSRLKTNDKNNQINIIPTYTRIGDEPEYRITGKIIISDDFVTVDIQLYQKSTGITWMPSTNGASVIYDITKTIEAQAEEIYNYIISIIQLNQSASAEAAMRQFKEKYAYKIDLLTDGEQKNALDELEIIESKYGESQE
ncbi:MAG: hypothetical protein LBQ67_03255, partial [Treponema sp.]|nr:hypothetical protein [Treponema sp.]